MPTVSLDKLEDAMEWASSDFLENEAYICRQTGKIYWIAGDPGMIDEEEIPEDIHNSDRYLPVPDKRNLDLGNPNSGMIWLLVLARANLPKALIRDLS